MTDNRRFLLVVMLLILSIILRVVFNWGQEPEFNPDSASYDEQALQITTLDFSTYAAERTPGYPLLMAVCGRNHVAILVTQLAMGVLISLLLFELALMETGNNAISVFVALLYSAGLNFLYFERTIMTETFTTFLTVLSVYYFRQTHIRDQLPIHEASFGICNYDYTGNGPSPDGISAFPRSSPPHLIRKRGLGSKIKDGRLVPDTCSYDVLGIVRIQ